MHGLHLRPDFRAELLRIPVLSPRYIINQETSRAHLGLFRHWTKCQGRTLVQRQLGSLSWETQITFPKRRIGPPWSAKPCTAHVMGVCMSSVGQPRLQLISYHDKQCCLADGKWRLLWHNSTGRLPEGLLELMGMKRTRGRRGSRE